jgi:hypothetical protein
LGFSALDAAYFFTFEEQKTGLVSVFVNFLCISVTLRDGQSRKTQPGADTHPGDADHQGLLY